MKTYNEAKKILQVQCVTSGGYDLNSLGVQSIGGYWYKEGRRLSDEEVDAIISTIPVDESAIIELMKM